ncbi:MAG: hypothetical protein RR814_06335 [Oscillospiraceae bacterium]
MAVGEQSEPIPAGDAKGKAVHFYIESMLKWAAFVLVLPKRFAAQRRTVLSKVVFSTALIFEPQGYPFCPYNTLKNGLNAKFKPFFLCIFLFSRTRHIHLQHAVMKQNFLKGLTLIL